MGLFQGLVITLVTIGADPGHGVQTALTVAGVLAADQESVARWCWCASWIYPVGDPENFARPDADHAPGYRVNRALIANDRGTLVHEGLDLSNRRPGGDVRAAAHGLVALAGTSASAEFGEHVVLAHRMPDGTYAYSIYAHLAPGTICVKQGQPVEMGDALGRVGRSGNATSDHLHFEVRVARNPTLRWELARVVDPREFVAQRLPASRPDAETHGRPIEWAAYAGLITPEDRPDDPLLRATWWRILARSARHTLGRVPDNPGPLRRALIRAGVLPANASVRSRGTVGVKEWERDLERLEALGLRLPVYRSLDDSLLYRAGGGDPAEPAARHRDRRPTLNDACSALAEISLAGAKASVAREVEGH